MTDHRALQSTVDKSALDDKTKKDLDAVIRQHNGVLQYLSNCEVMRMEPSKQEIKNILEGKNRPTGRPVKDNPQA